MLTALATAAAAVHPAMWHPVFFPFFFLIPLFWVAVVVLIIVFVARGRRRAWARYGAGYAPWAHGPWGHGGWGQGGWGQGGWGAARGAEATLAERFANGDIDEKEYRARLEVLRANGPVPPMPPQGPQGPQGPQA